MTCQTQDRKWLRVEFPQLLASMKSGTTADPFTLMEIGCGAGNTVFPLFEEWKVEQNASGSPLETTITIHACDYSKVAVDLVKVLKRHSLSVKLSVLELTLAMDTFC
jgi:tRNAThr (cytosine32-N3)-methyltransferase